MNSTNYIEDGEDPELVIKFLEEKIFEHNAGAINRTDGNYFSRIVKNENGVIIAGIAGWTWAGACEITQLWVDHSNRKNGLGKKLLNAAEKVAIDNGCKMILIKSYSFQAPEFYTMNGYKIEHIQNNFPDGFQYFILSKIIS